MAQMFTGFLVLDKEVSMTWSDLPVDGRARLCSLQKYAKHFIRLPNSSKSVIAWFATWNPGNWRENQIKIRSKTLLIPQTLRTLTKMVVSYNCQSRCTLLWLSHARATLGRTITGCVHSHEINRLQHCLGEFSRIHSHNSLQTVL